MLFVCLDPHGAIWVLTRDDVLALNKSCTFLNQMYGFNWRAQGMIREYMSSHSIFRNPLVLFPPANCMVTKVIPAQMLEVFRLEHGRRHSIRSGDKYLSLYNLILFN